MQDRLPAEKVQRIAEMFRQNLGRELTPEEQRYLGLSVVAVDAGVWEERRRNEGETS